MMDNHKSCLLITYLEELNDGEPILIKSNCLPVKAFRFEPAGFAFHSAALKFYGLCNEEDDDQSVQSDDKDRSYSSASDFYSGKSKKKSATGSKQADHYALLGLGHLRFLATEEQIKKSYRESALKHHPDKLAALILVEETEEAKQKRKDEIEDHFKSIQEAYEILMDPAKRRVYDSTDEFDDDIPTDCAPQDFFKVFGLAFMRNGRWSVNQPVPTLGEDNTSIEEVDKFYDFWYSFKSWREFPHADEFDLEQAESREHKRWMERQNVKLKEKARKEEHARVRALVDNAYRKDPRIIRRKEEEKAEKKRRKEAKHREKKLQEEEAARNVEEERRRKEEEERRVAEAALNLKKSREKEKKLLRKEKTRLRALVAPMLANLMLNVSEEDMEKVCSSLELEQLRDLCDDIEKEDLVAKKAELVKNMLDGDQGQQKTDFDEQKRLQNSVPKQNVIQQGKSSFLSSFQKKDKPWEKEEIEMLRKGMQKYPKGTSRRWEVISEYIGTQRSVEEILKATKTVLLQKPDSSKAFDSFLEKRKPVQIIDSPLSTRNELEGKSSVGAETSLAPSLSRNENGKQEISGVDSLPVASNGLLRVSEPDNWSEVQERALIRALKTFPKEANQRWERVAAAVSGKTVNQCKKKFSLMKESFRSKKNSD